MPSQPHNHNYPFDGLEPEFSSDDSLERRLLADGDRWRANTAPPVKPFIQRMNATLREHLPPADAFVKERPMAHYIVTPPPAPAQPPRHQPGKWSTLAAVAAAVVIVAMLAWVFQSIAHSRVANTSATPTSNSAAHVTHPRGHWADVVQYTVTSADDTIIVSPSDPRIAFRATRSQSNPNTTTLARTSDGGATWTDIALPTDDGGSFGALGVSPLDPQAVFLTLTGDQSNPRCPAYALGPGTDVGPATSQAASSFHADARLGPLHPTSGGYACSFQYVSQDGGAHWVHPSFPWSAQHFVDLGPDIAPVQVQGTTLFATVAGNLNGEVFDGARLVASDDGGTTWRAADTAIAAAGQIITSYAVVPGTAALYAMSVRQQTPAGQESSAALWRSEDAGMHWTRIGTAPTAQARLIATASTAGGVTLYAVALSPASPNGMVPIYASRDGGHTWSPAPTDGWPQGQGVNLWALNTLADGSLLLELSDRVLAPEAPAFNSNSSFYAWRPGDVGWFQVTPRPSSGFLTQSWLTTPASGPQTLWIVVQAQQGTVYTVSKCVLQ
jgi:hypothetical protein